jgi:hypothetical protein
MPSVGEATRPDARVAAAAVSAADIPVPVMGMMYYPANGWGTHPPVPPPAALASAHEGLHLGWGSVVHVGGGATTGLSHSAGPNMSAAAYAMHGSMMAHDAHQRLNAGLSGWGLAAHPSLPEPAPSSAAGSHGGHREQMPPTRPLGQGQQQHSSMHAEWATKHPVFRGSLGNGLGDIASHAPLTSSAGALPASLLAHVRCNPPSSTSSSSHTHTHTHTHTRTHTHTHTHTSTRRCPRVDGRTCSKTRKVLTIYLRQGERTNRTCHTQQ